MKPHRLLSAGLVATFLVLGVGHARADEAPRVAWRARYDAAKTKVTRGDCIPAIVELDELATTAVDATDRTLATELSSVCRAMLAAPTDTKRRSPEEMMLLYTSAFAYGVGTSAWFVLETAPNNVLAAMLPFAGFTLGAVGAVALVDRYAEFPRGVPQSIATGLYLGLGEGIWVLAMQHSRASRIRNTTGFETRWSTATDAAVLWSMATVGAVTSTLIGYARQPTPGRVAFSASATMWGGLLAAGISGAILPYGDRRTESLFLVGGLGYNAGLVTGLALGPTLSPSVARMRFVDLGGVAGGLLSLGIYALATQSDADQRAALGIASLGAATGLTLTWIATSGMQRDLGPSATKAAAVSVQPVLAPVSGGAQAGLSGVF